MLVSEGALTADGHITKRAQRAENSRYSGQAGLDPLLQHLREHALLQVCSACLKQH